MKNHYFDILSPHLTSADRLHFEIIDFFSFLSPMPFEEEMRHRVVNKLKTAMHRNLAKIKVRPFGSYTTGLYLPTSDIDISIDGPLSNDKFELIFQILIKEGLSAPENIKIINTTKIPLIKYTDKETLINVDISFENKSGTGSLQFVQHQLKTYPNISPLYLLIRQILTLNQLAEVYYGGLGSYSLFLMLVSFFQRHPRADARSHKANLGVLLLEFFELYGLHFRYDRLAIKINNDGAYVSRKTENDNGYESVMFILYDPNDENNIVSKGTYRMAEIKQLFANCFMELSKFCEDSINHQRRYTNWNSGENNLLNKIVFIPQEVQIHRQKLYYVYQSVIFSTLRRTGSQNFTRRYNRISHSDALGSSFSVTDPASNSQNVENVERNLEHFSEMKI